MSAAPAPGRQPSAYLLVDGENIDWSLSNLLRRKPESNERPRWDRLLGFAGETFGDPALGLFFINCPEGRYPPAFVQFLVSIGFRPVLVSGEGKVVDTAILRTLVALEGRSGHVVLASHDGDFVGGMERLLSHGGRRVGLCCFPELASGDLHALAERGLEIFDLERDVKGAFQDGVRLARLRVVPIDEFDPEEFLWLTRASG